MKRNSPHPKSYYWTLKFRLRPYKGQILDPEDITTYQLITFTRWANEYIQWREVHRLKEPTMESQLNDLETYEAELITIRYKKKNKC